MNNEIKNAAISVLHTHAVLLKELTGSVKHSALKEKADHLISEHGHKAEVESALFRVENLHNIAI